MGRDGARMRKSGYTRRLTTHHVPPPTDHDSNHTTGYTHPRTPATTGWRRADTLRRKVRPRRDARRATRRPSRDRRRRARGISFYFFSRARAHLDDARGRRGADDARASIAPRSRSNRDRERRRDRHPSVTGRRARGGFERDARRASGRSTAFVRDAGRLDEGRVDDGPIASTHPSSRPPHGARSVVGGCFF